MIMFTIVLLPIFQQTKDAKLERIAGNHLNLNPESAFSTPNSKLRYDYSLKLHSLIDAISSRTRRANTYSQDALALNPVFAYHSNIPPRFQPTNRIMSPIRPPKYLLHLPTLRSQFLTSHPATMERVQSTNIPILREAIN